MDSTMKLWKEKQKIAPEIETFTIGKDRNLDLLLAEFDVLGSIAHASMLQQVNLLTKEELKKLKAELLQIYQVINKGQFVLEEGVEDVHSQIEILLTRKLAEVGEKIHTGRSRNDQILVDIRMFIRNQIKSMVFEMKRLFDLLINLSEKYQKVFLPGYTHMQIAMPSSFGLWFAAYAESLLDDLIIMKGAYQIINKNPLGSAAGYGTSLPINRQITTDLLGFDAMNYNVVYAQMGRGKSEKIVSAALASVASTLAKLAADVCLYMNQNFGFISFPDKLTTGSSIMPHKKNPDVFELIRAKCNRLQALPNEMTLISANLPSGYHRDLQVLKENFLPSFQEIISCLKMTGLMLNEIKIHSVSVNNKVYQNLYSVEAVNKLVQKGMSFRSAYQKIAQEIAQGKFKPPSNVQYTHEGSIGNLQNDKITMEMEQVLGTFNFYKVDEAMKKLVD
jgi:argininosuccinate lyase